MKRMINIASLLVIVACAAICASAGDMTYIGTRQGWDTVYALRESCDNLAKGGTLTNTLTVAKGLTVTAGGATVTAGGLTVTAGGATVTAGGLAVTAGGATVGGKGVCTSTNATMLKVMYGNVTMHAGTVWTQNFSTAFAHGVVPSVTATYTEDPGDVRPAYISAVASNQFKVSVTADKNFTWQAIGPQ